MSGVVVLLVFVWFVLAAQVAVHLTCKCIFMAGQRLTRWGVASFRRCVHRKYAETTAQLDEPSM